MSGDFLRAEPSLGRLGSRLSETWGGKDGAVGGLVRLWLTGKSLARRLLLGYAFLGVFLLCPPSARAEQPCTKQAAECRFRLPLSSTALKAPYYGTEDITSGNPETNLAIIVVHGMLRNAGSYFASMVQVADEVGKLATTLVIAPQFQSLDPLPRPMSLFGTTPYRPVIGNEETWGRQGTPGCHQLVHRRR